jgi:hypothetical protein
MGRAYSAHRGDAKYVHNFGWKIWGKEPFGRLVGIWKVSMKVNLEKEQD